MPEVAGSPPLHPGTGERSAPAPPGATRPRRRGRPFSSEGPAVTRGAIVEAALATLQGEGSAGLSLRGVARRLGVTLPSIQRHFPTKDDLWRACVDLAVAEVAAERATVEGSGPSELDWLVAHLWALTERTSRLPGLSSSILNDTSEGSGPRLDYLVARAEPVLGVSRSRLEAAQLAGRVRQVDPEVLLALIVVGLSSVASSRAGLRRLFGIDLDDPAGAERFVAAMVELLRHGLAPPSPARRGEPGSGE